MTLHHEYPMAPKKHRRRRSPGRPRSSGPRKPCGRLQYVPPEPNARVVAERKAALGDTAASLATADSPLDLAHARGWITERQHRAGAAFVRIRTAAALGAPGYSGGGLEEAPEARVIDKRPLAQLSSAEIVAVWDQVVPLPIPAESMIRSANALMTWKTICAAVAPADLLEVERVCVQNSWPQWIVYRCHGNFESAWERKRDLLVHGLDVVAEVVFTRDEDLEPELARDLGEILAGGTRLAARHGLKREETTVYVDEDGVVLREVVKRGRRP